MTAYQQLDAWIDAHFDEEVRFLQALVQVPTDTPPGNNAPHAERTAELLAGFGFIAELHAVGYTGAVSIEVEDDSFGKTLNGRANALRVARNFLSPFFP